MKKTVVNAGDIYFLDFTFNPNFRSLHSDVSISQLRKKPSDVLALLCAKYPEPVSQAEFLAEVWDGGYVTPQSIAQIIRSLRLSLGDDSKSIIVTIPKLGYKLSVQPCSEKPGTVSDCPRYEAPSSGKFDVENVTFTAPSMLINSPVPARVMSAFPYNVQSVTSSKRKLTPQAIFLSAVAALCLSLICAVFPA